MCGFVCWFFAPPFECIRGFRLVGSVGLRLEAACAAVTGGHRQVGPI